MANKPQNDIEKLLSDYAKQRRDDAGTPELHPATRRLLQSEVRRQHPASDETNTLPTRSRWSIFWPRFAAACGVLAALAAVVVMVSPPEQPSSSMEMARSEEDRPASAPPAAPAATLASVPVVPPEASVRRESGAPIATKGGVGFVASETPRELSSDTASASGVAGEQPGAPAAFAAAPVEVEQRGAADGNVPLAGMGGRTAGGRGGGMGGRRVDLPEPVDASGSQPLPAIAAAQPAMTKAGGDVSPVAAADQMSKSANNAPNNQTELFLNNSLTQRYRNVVLVESQTRAATPAVLDEFIVEQNGNEMKIVDRDGSVYNGTISNLVPEGLVAMDNAATTYAAPAQASAAPAGETAMTLQAGAAPQRAQQFGGGGRGGFAGGGFQAQNFNEQQNFYFRVEGTNRSLRQRVVFTGNMIQNTLANSSQYNLSNNANTQQFRQQSQVQQVPGMNTLNLQMQNNFINGRVVLGDGRMSTEMNALQVEP